MNWIWATLIASSPLLIGELLYRLFKLKQEVARKVTHMLGGFAAVGLTFVLPLNQIALLMAGFTLALIIVRRFRLISALYDVDRLSYGEIFFPAGIGLAALIANAEATYIFAALVMGIADAVASIVGTQFGKTMYRIWLSEKSYVGTLAFFLTACVLQFIVLDTFAIESNWITMLIIADILAAIEAFAPFGSDNVLLPPTAAVLFNIMVI